MEPQVGLHPSPSARSGSSGQGQRSSRGSACDSCRRRRIKCDSAQPCRCCVRAGISCTYGDLQSRTSSVSYARFLERRVARLESLLQRAGGQTKTDENSQSAQSQKLDLLVDVNDDYFTTHGFYRRFSGLNVLRVVVDGIGAQEAPWYHPGQRILKAFEGAGTGATSSSSSNALAPLPSTSRSRALISRAITFGLVGHDCLDHQDLSRRLSHLAKISLGHLTSDDRESLALAYALFALGEQYEKSSGGSNSDEGDDASA